MRTFAVVNQKGGCGKTTTAINLAGVFASRGFRTLLVDMDPQGHCAAGLAIPEQRVDLNIGDAMLAPDDKPVDPARLLWRVMRNLDLAPSTLRLAALEASRGELAGKPDAEQRLRKVLARFGPQYDACIIDCSPAIGMLAFNALVAADDVLIPVETGFFSLQGASKQINTIKSLGKRLGVAPVHRLLATIHDPGSVLAVDLLEELRRRFGSRVIPVVIRQDGALKESASFGQPVIEYAPESLGAQDYSSLADWLVAHALRPGPGQTPPTDPEPAMATVPSQATSSIPPPSTALFAPTVSPVHVVPGIAQLAIAGVLHTGRQRSEAGAVSAVLDAARPAIAPVSASAIEPPTPLPTPEATISRAADMAARARRMQAQPVDIVAAPPIQRAATVRESGVVGGGEIQATSTPYTASTRYGVHASPKGGGSVIFRQPISLGGRVSIAGDFNAWSSEATPLRPDAAGTALEASVTLLPGTFQYRLVIDGRWVPDAFNPVTVPNPFGGSNSVISIPGDIPLAPRPALAYGSRA